MIAKITGQAIRCTSLILLSLFGLAGAARANPPISVAVVYPLSNVALAGATEAAAMRLIAPILTRPKAEIQALATTECLDIDSCEIVDVANDVAAAMKGVELCQTGKTDALMKSSLHTDHLMHAVMQDETGLRTKRRFSHVFVRDGQEAQEAGE